jgi:hypothetical protein
MIKIRKKYYKPKQSMIGVSIAMLILAVGMVEGATSIRQILIALAIAAVFGYIALSGDRQ